MISITRMTLVLAALAAGTNIARADQGEFNARLAELARSPGWTKLLHYKKSFFVGSRAEIVSRGFFLADNGAENPHEEIRATFETFSKSQRGRASEEPSDQAIECRFPARFLFLRRVLPEAADWRMPTCPRYAHFRDGIAARSATLVFSAYYLNNPASAFGHTFLRLNKAPRGGERHPLLDYGIGYAATAPDANPLTFAIGGLFGWFPGDFTNVPYYLKVQEYNDFESRDLWEYDLALTEDEIELLVAHTWELAATSIPYYYLNSNCSSLLFTLLEAAAPRLEIRRHLPYWVIPSDTVLALFKEPGLVEKVDYRPSKRSQFLERYRRLSDEGQREVAALARSSELAAKADQVHGLEAAARLDTLIDYFDFRYFRDLVFSNSEKARTKQRLLIARSRLPATTEPRLIMNPPELERPESGHGSARYTLGNVWTRSGETSAIFGQRFALHDHLDPQTGYPRDSQIDFMSFQLRALTQAASGASAEAAIRFEEAYAFAVRSYAPFEILVPNLSWKVRIGAERTWDETCQTCTAAVLGASGGLTFDLGRGRLLTTLLVSGDLSHAHEFRPSVLKLRLGPELNLRSVLSPFFVLQVNAQYLHLFFSDLSDAYRVSEELRWTSTKKIFALGSAFAHLPRGETEFRTQVYFYY